MSLKRWAKPAPIQPELKLHADKLDQFGFYNLQVNSNYKYLLNTQQAPSKKYSKATTILKYRSSLLQETLLKFWLYKTPYSTSCNK